MYTGSIPVVALLRLRNLGVGRSITLKQADVGLHACAEKPPAGHRCSLDYSVKLAVKRVA